MTNYEKGRQLEKKVFDYFRYHGFVGYRAAQSRGPYDVIVSPPTRCFIPATLHIQIGPKSKKQLQDLGKIAITHSGFKAHLYYSKAAKQPRIKMLRENDYSYLPTFLSKWYSLPIKSVLYSWKDVIKNQASMDREVRKAKKLG